MKKDMNDQHCTSSTIAVEGAPADMTTNDRSLYELSLGKRAFKRGFDLLVASVASVVFALPSAVIGLLVWAQDRHNPIFRQERVGRGGKTFTLYKFRSMRVDAEKDGTPQLCCDHDSRLTGVGSFIRSHHLDEFPQLWNVLCGDMSVVGPRPERPFFVEQIKEVFPDYEHVFKLRPGLFSEATLYNGYADTIEKMVRRAQYDLNYLRNYHIGTDIKIIWNTSISILSGKKF